MQPQELAERVQRIRLPKKDIAEKGDLDPNTVTRALAGTGGLASTRDKIADVLEREERALLAYLFALHGAPQ